MNDLYGTTGIAGMACALALRRVGHRVMVLEKTDGRSGAAVRFVLRSCGMIFDVFHSEAMAAYDYHLTRQKFCTSGDSKRSSIHPVAW